MERGISFLRLCKGFRVVTFALSSMIHLVLENYYGRVDIITWIVIIGVGTSCFLGNYLYTVLEGQRIPTLLTILLELFAYGIFVFVSGGFATPFFWYYICCLLILMNGKNSFSFVTIASLWGFFCALAGQNTFESLLCLKANIVFGMGMILGSYYILKMHMDKLTMQQLELADLNKKISIENERSEYALLQLSNIYETFDILAMRDPEEVMRLLVDVLRRTIAPKGLLLIKSDIEGSIESVSHFNMDEDVIAYFIKEIVVEELDHRRDMKRIITFQDLEYEVMFIGDEVSFCGILIRRFIMDRDKENDAYYLRLIEIIFKNIDLHVHMEQYISTEEKNRIADEIHDTAIQKLFGIHCRLKELEIRLEDGKLERECVQTSMKELGNSVSLTMKELRETIYGNRFENQNSEGLYTRLQLYMNEVSKLNHVNVDLNISEDVDDLQSAKKIVIYRVTCEAVNNAVRHGVAKNIKVDITCDERKVKVDVIDDGGGFKLKKDKIGGNGLKNMRRMANLIKGSLAIESRESGGVAIRLILPHE